MRDAIVPTLAELERRGAPYRGVLFCGLMLTADGPKVLEYNVRFGDPECQVLIPRVASDLYVHLRESASGRLETEVELADRRVGRGRARAARGIRPRPRARATSSAGWRPRPRTMG